MKSGTILSVLGTTALVYAAVLAPDDPNHDIPLPTRNLTWGDVNVLHTTDIHGWILGHPRRVYPEMSWSGTFGDFYSFVHHMRNKARSQHQDLFLVDTGDRRIGHGLTDKLLDPQHSVNGQLVSELYIDLKYDLVVPGNHDLINDAVVKYAIQTLADKWGGRYLTSNIRVVPGYKANSSAANVTERDDWPFLGAPYRYWKTENTKKNIMAFGAVLNKKDAYSPRIKVTSVVDMVNEDWFKGALKLPIDVFLVLGHIDPEKPDPKDNMKHIYDAIRKEHPLTPILMFGGHTHKRYCKQFKSDNYTGTRAMLLQSGHYFDTVGWMSAKLDDNKSDKDLVMTRRYLDNNVPTYMFHTQKSQNQFHLKKGVTITNYVHGIDRVEGLAEVFGYLGSSYFMDRKKWTEEETDPESLFSLYLNATESIVIDKARSPNWMFLSNWGIFRGDIYSGAFTLGDLYTISPNDNLDYLHVKVKRSVADALVGQLQKRKPRLQDRDRQHLRAPIMNRTMLGDGSQVQFSLGEPSTPRNLTYGLKTIDGCGESGDDVEHVPIPQVVLDGSKGEPEVYFWRKSWRKGPVPSDDTEVDLIVTNYIGEKRVPPALYELTGRNLTLTTYRPDGVKQDRLLGVYIREKFGTITKNIPLPE